MIINFAQLNVVQNYFCYEIKMDADFIIMNIFEKLRAIHENDTETTDRVLYEIKQELVEYFSSKNFPKRKQK